MAKQFIWRIMVLGFELIGVYWNIKGDSVDGTDIVAGLTIFDGLTIAICRDDRRYFLNGVCSLYPSGPRA